MELKLLLEIAGGLIIIGGVSVALAKFFSNQNKTLTASDSAREKAEKTLAID